MTSTSAYSLRFDLRLPLDRFELQAKFETRQTVTGIFGPSGSGKSSLLESLAGLRSQATGSIFVQGRPWLDSSRGIRVKPEDRRIGYVPQDGLLFPDRSVAANLRSGRRRAIAAGGPWQSNLDSVIDLLELAPLLERRALSLSGGERQRVALGRAVCSGPSLLVLDEPLAALDLPHRRRLLLYLRLLKERFQIPWVLVTHDPIEVQALCDELVVLGAGQIVAQGKPAEVLVDPGVYGLHRGQGYENVLPAKREQSQDGTHRVSLTDTSPTLKVVTGHAQGQPGSSVFLGIDASEIMVATTKPEGLSARNTLAGTITKLHTAGMVELVTIQLGDRGPKLVAEVTASTIQALGLASGQPVYAVFKATACRVFGG